MGYPIKIYDGDSLSVVVTTIDMATGQALNLSAATVELRAGRNGTVVQATSTITNAPNGEFTGLFSAGQLDAGRWKCQARVTIGAEVQTVAAFDVLVNPAV